MYQSSWYNQVSKGQQPAKASPLEFCKQEFRMQNITIRKQPGANYHRLIKSCDLERGGVTVGTLQP